MLDNKKVEGDNHKMGYQNYKNLEVYQLAHKLAVDVHAMTSELPRQEMYEESSQIRKSSKSICSNIVEGFGRRRYKNDFIQFLTYALASCDETREHLELLHDTNSLHDEKSYKCLSEGYNILGRKLTNFISAVETNHLPHKTKNPNLDSRIKDQGSRIKGVTLIIVVFAMMLFGVLGWTLARMQATDFESNLRTFEPDNALNLAEAGAQWALNQLSANSSCRSQSGLLRCPPLAAPAIDTDCNDSGDWLSTPHSLSPGQYNLCLRDSCATCSPAEGGDVVIISRGYIPAQSGSRVMRQIKLEVDIGSLTNALQTQTADPNDTSVGLFNWSAANNFPPAAPIHNPTRIEGAISAGHYEGDGDGVYDELPPGDPNYDYDPPPAPILPDDNNNPENDIRDFTASYPAIDMQYFYDNATNRWPAAGRILSATVTVIAGGNRLQAAPGFFAAADEDNVAVKRQNGSLNNDNDWTVITNVLGGGSLADISPNVAAWPDEDLITPGIQVAIKLVRRFYQDAALQRWYIGRQISGGETADALIDLSSNNIDLTQTYIVSEGDIVINGGRRLRMRFFGGPLLTRYPNLATQNGNILSTDQPNGANENSRRDQRRFDGLIYSQNGEVSFNYLDGRLVYGKQVTLDGTVRIRYTNGRITSGGFVFEPSTLTWKEE